MPGFVTPAIPASLTVAVNPSVLAAGGTALDLIGLELTQSVRPPIGQVLDFVNAADVADYFGPTSQEAAHAAIYFRGPNRATATPGQMLFAQYPESAVAGYLRGGNISAMTLAQLQAITASALTIVRDGGGPVTQTLNLSSATSFSNAAALIGQTMVIHGPQEASTTGSLGGTFGTCTTSGTTLTLGTVTNGYLSVGDTVTGTDTTNTLNATILAQTGGTPGGSAGATFTISAAATPGNMTSATVTGASTKLRVATIVSGALAALGVIAGTGITTGTYIQSQISGTTGGVGFYQLAGSAQTAAAGATEAIIVYAPGCYFDAQLDAFVIQSSTTGVTSSVAYASGAAATSLLLTLATGAVLSPGAAAAVPATFMDGIIQITQNWLSFMTAWEGSDAEKEAFATWNNNQNNRYRYCMHDTSATNIAAGGPSAPVAFVNNGSSGYLNANGLSGIVMIHENPNVDTIGGELAAFMMSWAASLDHTRRKGRQTADFKSQSGLAAQVFNGTIVSYLTGYGLNYYGSNTTANEDFVYYAQGSISGPFLWDNSYCNQVWLNNQLQLAIMVGLTEANSVSYNEDGANQIESFCLDPINEAVNFGAIVAGVRLSAAQITAVNNQAGVDIDQTLFQRGWYLQVQQAIPQVRRARTSPPCTFWYTDGGDVQQITLASIEIQ